MHYRLYWLHRETGRIVNGIDLEAENDEAAIVLARAQAPGVRFELWLGTRQVHAEAASLD